MQDCRAAIALFCCTIVAACGSTLHPLPPAPRPAEVWATTEEPPRAVILALHGFNDYRHAFADFATFAAARGYRVESFDQQGFGANPNRGLWPGSEALARDLARRVAELHRDWPGTPLYVLGESMGAAVAVVALGQGDLPPVDGVILVSPAVWGDTSFNGFYRLVLEVAAGMAPGWTLTGRGLGVRASDNDEALIAMGRDPMLIKETRLDAIAGLVRLMDEARQDAGKLDVPVLILLGERDEIIPPEAIRSFVGLVDPAVCHAIAYENGWHLLLRDLQAETVWRDILAWIDGDTVAPAEWRCPKAG
ncbi:MAG TPA: alpha/beta fold hydrolase [Geminicoccaceae bacterium]|nr:alpha/beta fold hydrolase [Geminicoccaceae bacterium]